MENIAQYNPKMVLGIMVKSLFEDTKMKIMSMRLEKPDIENLDKLKALSAEHWKTLGCGPAGLEEDIEYA